MTDSKMLKLCKTALQKLDDLEALLSHFPAEKEADRFVYTGIRDVRELQQIAKFETQNKVTTQQAAHINRILEQGERLLQSLPDSARRELDDD